MDLNRPHELNAWIDAEPPLPPLPPDDGDRRPRRDPPRPAPRHGHEGMLAMFLGLCTLVAMGGVQMVAIRWSARGGYVGAVLVSMSLMVLFIGPFLVGSIWIGRRRDERDR